MEEVVSRCPVCGARVNVNAGSPTPPHRVEDGDTPCEGAGQPSD